MEEITYIQFIAAAITAIWIIIGALKKAIPWLAGNGSRYIPIIALAMSVGVAVFCYYHYGLDIVQVFITAIVPALASSGAHSYFDVARNDYLSS